MGSGKPRKLVSLEVERGWNKAESNILVKIFLPFLFLDYLFGKKNFFKLKILNETC